MSEACENCKYFQHTHAEGSTLGWCRRYPPEIQAPPPTTTYWRGSAEHPIVDEGAWCGEYESAPNAPDNLLLLPVKRREDGHYDLLALRHPDDDWSYYDPELVDAIHDAVAAYPNYDAPSWLAPVAILRKIEDRLLHREEV